MERIEPSNASGTLEMLSLDFSVTPTVKRFVNVYLLCGQRCYLIDAGVAGHPAVILDKLRQLGRAPDHLAAILLTHAHPDHMGGAAALSEATGCRVLLSEAERSWAEDIDLQFRERPIPNFYQLADRSVSLSQTVADGDVLALEPGITLQVIGAAGHSHGSVCYLWQEQGILFSGDAIPNAQDLPILVDWAASQHTLSRLQALPKVTRCCPAWDHPYDAAAFPVQVKRAQALLQQLANSVHTADQTLAGHPEEEKLLAICQSLGADPRSINPLFQRSVAACREAQRTHG